LATVGLTQSVHVQLNTSEVSKPSGLQNSSSVTRKALAVIEAISKTVWTVIKWPVVLIISLCTGVTAVVSTVYHTIFSQKTTPTSANPKPVTPQPLDRSQEVPANKHVDSNPKLSIPKQQEAQKCAAVCIQEAWRKHRMKKREAAATTIQMAWRRYSKKPDYNGAFGVWYQENRRDYIAHAIWKCNIDRVFEAGIIKPAETILRETRVVEYEAGGRFGARSRIDLSQFPAAFWEDLKQELPEPSSALLILNGRLTYSCEVKQALYDGYEKLCRSYPELKKVNYYHLFILRDEIAQVKVDAVLANYYENHKEEDNVEYKLFDLRDSLFCMQKLNDSIRAGRNCIYWSYGDVVVLRGKAQKMIKELRGTEAILHSPYTNQGNPLLWPLKGSAVLGPKAILEKHKNAHPDTQFFYIEDITARQFNMIKAPWRLDHEAVRKLQLSNSPSGLKQ